MRDRTGYQVSPGGLDYPTTTGHLVRLIPGYGPAYEGRLEDVKHAMAKELAELPEGARKNRAITYYLILMAYVLWDDPGLAWEYNRDQDEVDELKGEALREVILTLEAELTLPRTRRRLTMEVIMYAVMVAAKGGGPDGVPQLLAVIERRAAKEAESVEPGESQAE